MNWLLLLLTLLVCLANFGDFLLGDKASKPVREKLLRMYVSVEDGDWRRAYQAPAELVMLYANKLLGRQQGFASFLLRLLLLGLLLNAFMSAILLLHFYTDSIARLLPKAGAVERYLLPQLRLMAWSLPGNLIGDAIAWVLSLVLVSRLRNARPASAILLLLAAFLALYVVIALAIALRDHFALVAAVYGSPWTLEYLKGAVEVPLSLRAYSVFERPWQLSTSDFVAIAQVTLPIALFLAVSIIGLLVYSLRSVLRRPLTLVLERMEASPKSVLTLAAAVLSALSAAIAAWIKAAAS